MMRLRMLVSKTHVLGLAPLGICLMRADRRHGCGMASLCIDSSDAVSAVASSEAVSGGSYAK